MSIKEPILLRPHHGLCIRYFVGEGYSKPFAQNMKHVIASLNNDPQQMVTVAAEIDCLCSCCPHHSQGSCDSQQKVMQYDANCLRLCGLQNGQQLLWAEFQAAVAKAVHRHGVEQLCKGCQWLSLCSRLEKDRS